MCGIVGLKNFNNREIIDKNKFLFFLDSLKHRGPDGKDIYFNKNRNLALGHQINYYIILESLNSIHKKNLSMEFTL